MEQLISSRVRIGGFELNLETGELRSCDQHADVVLLREQPFQILKMLVLRGGKIVTREEIRKRLWPNDTVVNFDQGINAAIRILRREFGDSADSPQYIETVARRGYRLMVATEPLPTTVGGLRPLGNTSVRPISGPEGILGKKISHYRVLEVIGGGGMGMVYKAEDLKLGRRVALKFLPEELAEDPIALRRFEREAQTASALNHPNICTIYTIEEYEGQPFIVMELLDGESLHHRLETSPSKILPLPEIFEVAAQVCDGLQAAHESGIIHRDIKPANIFLTKSGQVKILDFGLAKLIGAEEVGKADIGNIDGASLAPALNGADQSHSVEPALTVTGAAMGTVGYMSPEQVRREKLDCTTDLFSFGLVLYEASTGRRAFVADTIEESHQAILTESSAPVNTLNPKVPRKLGAVIVKAIEKERTRRYHSAIDMRRAIERARQETTSARRRKIWGLVAAAVVVAAILGLWGKERIEHPLVLSKGDSVVLAVTNNTQDLVFDDAIYAGLYWDLRQTPFFHVLDLGEVQRTLAALHLPQNSKNTPDISRRVCERTHSKLLLAASITQEGNGFRIDEEGTDCQTGKLVARTRDDAANRSGVIRALGLATTTMRARLGEPKPSREKFNAPLEIAMTSSPEAIQLLTDGYLKFAVSDTRGAVSDFQRSLDLDPNFVMALAAIAAANNNLGRTSEGQAEISRAFELRSQAAIPVRWNVEDLYYDIVTGELEKQENILLQWVQDFPDDYIAHNNLGRCAWRLGQQDRALAEARDSTRLLPSPFPYYNLIYREIFTNRFEEAHATLKETESRGFDDDDLHHTRVGLAFLESDQKELQRQWQWAEKKSKDYYRFLHYRARIEGFYGNNRASHDHSLQAVDIANKDRTSEDATVYLNTLVLYEAELGNKSQAQEILARSSSMKRQRFTPVALALAYARTGNTSEAERLADQIARDFPRDTLIHKYSLPTIRAAIALEQQNGARAVEELRDAIPYDLSAPDDFGFGDMYPAYIRGLAYLQLRQGQSAEAEFQKLIDRNGFVGWDVIGALARLQIARAQRMAGEVPKAKASYASFLKLWKDADPDIPIYQQAKSEYAQLLREAK